MTSGAVVIFHIFPLFLLQYHDGVVNVPISVDFIANFCHLILSFDSFVAGDMWAPRLSTTHPTFSTKTHAAAARCSKEGSFRADPTGQRLLCTGCVANPFVDAATLAALAAETRGLACWEFCGWDWIKETGGFWRRLEAEIWAKWLTLARNCNGVWTVFKSHCIEYSCDFTERLQTPVVNSQYSQCEQTYADYGNNVEYGK